MPRIGSLILVVLTGFFCGPPLQAQAPGVPIEGSASLIDDPLLIKKAEVVRKTTPLLDKAKVEKLLAAPQGEAVALPTPAAQPLTAREVYRRARLAYVRLGWYFRCRDCEDWHLDLAGGYAIATGGVCATCYHALEPRKEIREGFLIASTLDNKVLPVTAILAASKEMDVAVVRVAGGNFTPLALSEQVWPGDDAYCFSDPLEIRGYFSSGIVNRFYWLEGKEGDPKTLAGVTSLRLNVSTDWAPGSSGAAILDNRGNAIGHVAAVTTLSDSPLEPSPEKPGPEPPVRRPVRLAAPEPAPEEEADEGPAILTLHEAIPARGVMYLLREKRPSPKAP